MNSGASSSVETASAQKNAQSRRSRRPLNEKREHAEKGDRQPEKVQGGLVTGTADTNRRADEQGEDTDANEHEIRREGTAGCRLQGELVNLLALDTEHRVGEAGLLGARVEDT